MIPQWQYRLAAGFVRGYRPLGRKARTANYAPRWRLLMAAYDEDERRVAREVRAEFPHIGKPSSRRQKRRRERHRRNREARRGGVTGCRSMLRYGFAYENDPCPACSAYRLVRGYGCGFGPGVVVVERTARMPKAKQREWEIVDHDELDALLKGGA